MSRRFNPVSAGVAAVTATVILGIAGCAMGTRTETTDQTDSAGLSREANMNSQAPVQGDTSSTMPSTTAMDTPAPSSTSSTTVALPAEPAPVAAPMANDTAAIPPADTSQPMASTSTYPSTTASTSSNTAVNTTPSTPSTSSGTTSTTSSTDMSGSSNNSNYSSLPPRTDRN